MRYVLSYQDESVYEVSHPAKREVRVRVFKDRTIHSPEGEGMPILEVLNAYFDEEKADYLAWCKARGYVPEDAGPDWERHYSPVHWAK